MPKRDKSTPRKKKSILSHGRPMSGKKNSMINPNSTEVITPQITQPINPSSDLFGLRFGIHFVVPSVFPTKTQIRNSELVVRWREKNIKRTTHS